MTKLGRLNLLIVLTIVIFAANVFGGTSIAYQSDGKAIVAYTIPTDHPLRFGATVLRRFTPRGEIDTTFGYGGRTNPFPGEATSLVVRADNKIVVGGRDYEQDFLVLRYNADGSPDSTFGAGAGFVKTSFGTRVSAVRDVYVYPDGKIMAVGMVWMPGGDFGFARYNADGTLDTSFGFFGVQLVGITDHKIYANDVFVNPYGTIKVVGIAVPNSTSIGTFAIVQLTPRGTLDTSFDGDGKFLGSTPIEYFDSLWQGNGQLILGGSRLNRGTQGTNTSDIQLMKLNSGGSLDTSFGVGGIRFVDTAPYEHTVGILQDDLTRKIIQISKISYDGTYALNMLRFNADGSLDRTFGVGGMKRLYEPYDSIKGMAFAYSSSYIMTLGNGPDGYLTLTQYNPNGDRSTVWGTGGQVIFPQ